MNPQPEWDEVVTGPCPECHIIRTMWDQTDYGKNSVQWMAPWYQRSYLGSDEYISPRCSPCYEKAMKQEKEEQCRTMEQK